MKKSWNDDDYKDHDVGNLGNRIIIVIMVSCTHHHGHHVEEVKNGGDGDHVDDEHHEFVTSFQTQGNPLRGSKRPKSQFYGHFGPKSQFFDRFGEPLIRSPGFAM